MVGKCLKSVIFVRNVADRYTCKVNAIVLFHFACCLSTVKATHELYCIHSLTGSLGNFLFDSLV